MVCRVFAAKLHGRIVIVDLPEDLLTVMGEGPEVMLAVRIVVFGEVVESANLVHDISLILLGQGSDALGEVGFPADEGFPEIIVQECDPGKLARVGGHYAPPFSAFALMTRR